MSPPSRSPDSSGVQMTRRGVLLAAGTVIGIAAVGALPTVNALGVEPWGGYANGQIPVSQLTAVAGCYFRNDAAQALVQLRAAFRAALGRDLVVNDGYRDLAGQQQAWDDYRNHGGNLAAFPGTSNHGWALAADFGGDVYTGSWTAGHQWMQANAPAFGWTWAGQYFSQIEYWHWEYNGSYSGPIQDDQSAIYRRNNNMASLFYKTEGGLLFALAGDGPNKAGWLEIVDQNLANQLAAQHGNAAYLSLATWNQWKGWYMGGA
ncbi:M15 family metallopeptidase [Microbacterium sp. MYb64]|uniref:M15 family metallopeptidase n=1 Tax=Microbacterium sp. MYb64 TaxID=1848691 RepID=UPI0011B0AB2D|nr:M15 family metallopeptidase [Microbacterium sp. MYb64]